MYLSLELDVCHFHTYTCTAYSLVHLMIHAISLHKSRSVVVFLKHSDASGAFTHGILLKWYNDVLYLLIVRLIICPRREVSSYISPVVNGIAVWITETHTNIKVN